MKKKKKRKRYNVRFESYSPRRKTATNLQHLIDMFYGYVQLVSKRNTVISNERRTLSNKVSQLYEGIKNLVVTRFKISVTIAFCCSTHSYLIPEFFFFARTCFFSRFFKIQILVSMFHLYITYYTLYHIVYYSH